MTQEEADKLDADLKFNGRIARDNWVDQARTLTSPPERRGAWRTSTFRLSSREARKSARFQQLQRKSPWRISRPRW